MADLDRLVAEVEIDVTTKGADAAKHTAVDLGTVMERMLEPPAHLLSVGSLRPEDFCALPAEPRRREINRLPDAGG